MVRLYNTLTNTKEELRTLEEGVVRIYTCGPTVYDFAHIGNFRTFVFQDLLRRYLRYRRFRVLHVMNITDVDDKTIQNAKAAGMSLKDYTEKYVGAFLQDSRALGLEAPEIMPRATAHIQDMIDLIRRLGEKGFTYQRDGSTYYSIARFPGYGKLSKKDFSGMQTGARVDLDEYEKDDARDFVLWKAHKEGEDFWETEIGPGRPGWHIECSAMSMKYLGETFDIHCGGVDLIFPHHENEIAQSEGATGKQFVRYWIHPEFLLIEGEKMAKSKGNHFTLRDLVAKGHQPHAIRYLLLSAHYRKQLNFTWDGLGQKQVEINRVQEFVLRMKEKSDATSPCPEFARTVDEAREKFIEAMDDDLNTPAALGVLFDFIRSTYRTHDAEGLRGGDARVALEFIQEVDQVLGVVPEQEAETPDDEIRRMIDERQAARRRRDFAEADRIRALLQSQGIQIEDTRDGIRWKRSR